MIGIWLKTAQLAKAGEAYRPHIIHNLAEFTARFNLSANPLTNRSFFHNGWFMSCRMAWVSSCQKVSLISAGLKVRPVRLLRWATASRLALQHRQLVAHGDYG